MFILPDAADMLSSLHVTAAFVIDGDDEDPALTTNVLLILWSSEELSARMEAPTLVIFE